MLFLSPDECIISYIIYRGRNMKIIRHSAQSGSATTFLVVGIILTIGLIGAVYALNQHGEQVRKEQAIATYDKQQAANKKTETPNVPVDTNSDTTKETAQVASTQELPTTGPESVVGELLGAGLLSVFIVSYLLSRRELAHTL